MGCLYLISVFVRCGMKEWVVRAVLLSPVVVDSREQVLRDGREKTPPGGGFSGMVKNLGDSAELLSTVSFTDEHTTVIDLTQTTIQMGTETQVGRGAKKPCDTTPTTRCVLARARKRVKQPGTAKSSCRLGALRDRSVCS